jgi:hypothetical protein
MMSTLARHDLVLFLRDLLVWIYHIKSFSLASEHVTGVLNKSLIYLYERGKGCLLGRRYGGSR